MCMRYRAGIKFNFKDERAGYTEAKGYQADLEHTDASCACSDRCDFIITSKEIADSITNPRARVVCITNYINKSIIEKEIDEVLTALKKEQG